MPEDEFEIYLTLLAKTLRLSDTQRDAIAAELRDHMEARLRELTLQGVGRERAIETALAEFGDASALANDLTQQNPSRKQKRRHLMQTTFGTVLTCAAVTFAVMLLTPSNKDGQPNQPAAVAQDDAFEGGFDDFGAEEADAFGGMGGVEFDDFGGGVNAGFGGARLAPAPKLVLSIQVVDCTKILRPDRDRGDLLKRTAALANAVQNTVGTVNEQGPASIQVQPFEEFLIITATESAHDEASALLAQIGQHVARRSELERDQQEEQRRHERAMIEQRVALETQMSRVMNEIRVVSREIDQLEHMRETTKLAQGDDHPDVIAIMDKIGDLKHKMHSLEDVRAELEMDARTLR